MPNSDIAIPKSNAIEAIERNNRVAASRNRCESVLLAWLTWLLSFGALWTIAHQLGLSYHLNVDLLWPLFGMPESHYGFRNIALPMLLAHVAVASPAALAGIAVYQCLAHRDWNWTLRRIVVVVGGFLAMPAISVGVSTMTEQGLYPVAALTFLGFLGVASAFLFRIVTCEPEMN